MTAAYREYQINWILQVVEECFARSGFQAAFMGEVIATVGMSSSTFCRCFSEGKRLLVHKVLTRHMGPFVERIKQFAELEALLDFKQESIEAFVLLNYGRGDAERHVGEAAPTSRRTSAR